MLDSNEDIANKKNKGITQAIRAIQELGLRELIIERHQDERKPPGTHLRGIHPIDGIFGTPTVKIKQGGYRTFDPCLSDHRLIWIDISTEDIMGNYLHKVVRPKARKLKSDDPIAVKKFMESLEKHVTSRGLINRAITLEKEVGEQITNQQAEQLELLDKEITQGILKAEKTCRHIYLGNIPYSKKMIDLKNKYMFWKLVSRRQQGAKVRMRTIIRLQRKCKIDGKPTLLDKEEVRNNFRQAINEYNDFKPHASDERVSWLEELAQEKAIKNDTTQEEEIRKMIDREDMRKVHRRIRRMNGKDRNAGTSMVTATNEEGIIEEITDREGLEEAIIDENRTKFIQSGDTPFYLEPLRSEFDEECKHENYDKVLEGTYVVPEGVDEYSKILIQGMVKHDETAETSNAFTTNEWVQEWTSSKESTSSGMSGLHFGHMITICKESRGISSMLAAVTSTIMKSGYSLNRYKNSLNVMLLKKLGKYSVKDLRTIQLFEPDFNKTNKLIAKSMMKNAEESNAIVESQYGNRKGHRAVYQALNKRLTFDIVRQKRVSAILCSNDAKSCYDRIIHPLVMMALRRLGVPKGPIYSMIESFQTMKHYIRTAYGDSD